MRTIKFRGRSIGMKTWLYGDLFKFGVRAPQDIYCVSAGVPSWADALDIYQVEEQTIGQFVGLYDMNGKEIYEGDVLMIEGIKTNRYSKVWWNPEKFTFFIGHAPLDAYLKKGDNLCAFCIAGNIYDNPELKEKLV